MSGVRRGRVGDSDLVRFSLDVLSAGLDRRGLSSCDNPRLSILEPLQMTVPRLMRTSL